MTFIAIDDSDSPVGSVALVAHDMPDRTDLTHVSPWVAGTFVIRSKRGKGIGKMLMRHAVAEADRVGAGEMFLYASTARPFYERLGWTLLREDFYEGERRSRSWRFARDRILGGRALIESSSSAVG